ncbi:MAG: hypothetical protein RL026_1535 [Pseudomonadota bacterium]
MTAAMETTIELAPHNALTTSQAQRFFLGICAGSFLLAGSLAILGFWPILGFAGLEMAALGWALKLSLDRRHRKQTILITDDQIRVLFSKKDGPPDAVVFPRHWAQVKLRRPRVPRHPSRLVIECSGKGCEVGQFLTEDDRQRVARRLQGLVGKTGESPQLPPA